MSQSVCIRVLIGLVVVLPTALARADHLRNLQTQAIEQGRSHAAHWGWDAANYTAWGSHSSRLIPVYTFGTKGAGEGVDLESYTGANSPYRSEEQIARLYGSAPLGTLAPEAEYLDQTNIFDIQRAALEKGKKHIFLVVFDGMDWNTTRAAAIYNRGRVEYSSGRGAGTHFQDYQAGGSSQFGYMVTSPHNDGTKVNADDQTVTNPGGMRGGGYDPARGGPNPWTLGDNVQYLAARPGVSEIVHPYTDSASSAVSMTCGLKTYNNAINVNFEGQPAESIAHLAQRNGYAVGAVSSVPISHATPAAAYAHNVTRQDYQDISRDLLGLPSISHPTEPLPGMDVVIAGGYGVNKQKDSGQGVNFLPGSQYLADADLERCSVDNGGNYVIARRAEDVSGAEQLAQAAAEAVKNKKRLLGFYGVGAYKGHLPYQTADGDFQPAPGRKNTAEVYSQADLLENPTLAEMTRAALTVLQTKRQGFWLMVEPGDVDWANHDNNLDASIGAVNSGDASVKVITDWVEAHSSWDESVLIVTADHGHFLMLEQPELLIDPNKRALRDSGN